MTYPEFNQYESFVDPSNPFCNAYKTKEGHIFYVEPGFYDGMRGFKEKRREDYPKILEAIYDYVSKHEKTVFTWDFENPFMIKEGYLYREIHDFTDPLQIFVEDKSRGSDYGD